MGNPKYLLQVNKDLQELRESTEHIKQQVAGHEALAHGWRLDVSRQLHTFGQQADLAMAYAT
eukprot:13531524-Alexandrium_andersonii.AAC.1